MPTRFDIPLYPYQSTNGARTAYEHMFNLIWPHDDEFLRQLAHEVTGPRRCTQLLLRMRENHATTKATTTE